MMLLYLMILTHIAAVMSGNSTRCKFSDDCYPSQEDMAHLDEDMQGTLYLPNMEEYKHYALAYNTYEQRYPSLIAMVKSASDIQAAILWARKFNLHVTIRSSGHCYLGRSTADGSFNINLAWMKEMEVTLNSTRSEYGEIKVQTGLTWIEIYNKTNEYKRVVVGGSAHTVTPGGYTLGGGHSPVSRSLGYAVDNVLEFQIVLANGDVATCTESQCVIIRPDNTVYNDTSGDLFWAVRGGGGGTYGVVVYFVYKLHPDTQMVHVFGTFPFKVKMPALQVEYDITDVVLDSLVQLIQNLPKEWGGYWLVDNAFMDNFDSRVQSRVIIHGKLRMSMNKFAPWDGTEKDVFKKFLFLRDTYNLDFRFFNKTNFLDYEVAAALDPPTLRTTFFATLLQNESFDDALKSFIKKEMYETYPIPEVIGCIFIMLGGKTKEFPDESTPLNRGYRSAISSVACAVILGVVNESNYFQAPLNDAHLTTKVDKSALQFRTFGEGMYFNEASKNSPYWREEFWNDYPRLLAIKRKFDPDNFFTCHQCVGSEEMEPVDTSRGLRLTSAWAILIFVIVPYYV